MAHAYNFVKKEKNKCLKFFICSIINLQFCEKGGPRKLATEIIQSVMYKKYVRFILRIDSSVSIEITEAVDLNFILLKWKRQLVTKLK